MTAELAGLGYREAVLRVVPQNDRARRFYESEQWRDDHVHREDEVFGAVVPEMRYRRTFPSAGVLPSAAGPPVDRCRWPSHLPSTGHLVPRGGHRLWRSPWLATVIRDPGVGGHPHGPFRRAFCGTVRQANAAWKIADCSEVVTVPT